MTPHQINKARSLRQLGYTIKDVATLTGLTWHQVRGVTEPKRQEGATALERERKRLLAQSDDPEWVRVVISNFGEA